MGIGRALRLVREADALTQRNAGLASPWSEGTLSSIVWSDVFGTLDNLPITRAEAIAHPAVARARDRIATTGARLNLEAWRGDEKIADQPPWLYRGDGGISPWHRMLWTIDDLIFGGWSLWAVARPSDGAGILEAARVPVELWEWDADRPGRVLVDKQTVPADSVVLIPGPHEGIVNRNAEAIRAARALERAYLSSARNPTPDVELHQTDGVPLTDAEIEALLAQWRTARQAEGGAVAFTPSSIEVREHGKAAEALLIDGRNAASVDMARIVGTPAATVDATNAGASLTYETTQGRNLESLDYGVEAYLGAIEARLSLDDVVPRGTSVRFDRSPLTELRAPASGPVRED